ncbi:tripartite tricarboxylate transporter substrate binding protein [Roseomonas sp. HJA6]|uniref:Tripartite tricarboxylate transporter substrate binding protein n=1 Tax=Roseomonas alba TaxID=2846776 RepID=A0ABS7AGC1_9PROT|nr:tripartite tricarboxylate transporter substrate binding protein [Neoroseomonas alba]MBW6401334.1 tripartite tricarboxylate transporter substrate binding protein [Neoroseomonas alba]
MIHRRSLVLGSLSLPAIANAQPAGPLRVICPWAPGGTTDAYLRGVAPLLSARLGRDVVVENRGGASGSVALGWLKNQRPDGSVISLATDAAFRVAIVQPVPYDALKDFDYLGGMADTVSGWAVRRDSPITSLGDLVERARAKPEGLTYAAGGTPDNPPLGMRLLEHRSGVSFLFVPFAGGSQMVTAVLGGTVDVVFDSMGTLAGPVEGDALRLLALAAEERASRWPDTPTARELGFDAVHTLHTGFIAPRGLPVAVKQQFAQALQSVAADPAHGVLLQRLALVPWTRDAAGYEEAIRTMFRELPVQLRELGLPTRL